MRKLFICGIVLFALALGAAGPSAEERAARCAPRRLRAAALAEVRGKLLAG
jgi:hypothetical protein